VTIKGLLFDLDGTLVNTNKIILACFDYACQTCLGHQVPQAEFINYFGIPLLEGMEALFPGRGRELSDTYRAYQVLHHDELIEKFPHMEETLAKLAADGIKMAVVTSKKQETARQGLRCCGIEQYFSAVIGNGDVEEHKPAAQPSLKGLQALGLKGSECLCIGDSPYDLISGRAAGCKTVAVRYSLFDQERLLHEGQPDYTISSIVELPKIIERLNKKEA